MSPEEISRSYTGSIVVRRWAYANGIHALVWSPDNKWLVSGNQDPSVHLWIPEQDIELHMSGYETKVKYLSFDHTSRWLATSGGRDACIWDCSGEGPEGIARLNPFARVEAETIALASGIKTENCDDTGGGQNVTQISNGDYIKVRNVNFADGVMSFQASSAVVLAISALRSFA